eukprot:1461406-Rhodomonas_salina.2
MKARGESDRGTASLGGVPPRYPPEAGHGQRGPRHFVGFRVRLYADACADSESDLNVPMTRFSLRPLR